MEILNKIIRKLRSCYDRETVKSEADIVGLFTRNNLMSDKDLRLFAVWCAREALKFIENPDPRSVMACDVAERYANGDATIQELSAARSAAEYAAWSVVGSVMVDHVAWSAAVRSEVRSAAWSAARSATRSASVAASVAAQHAAAAAEHASATDSIASWHAARSAQVDKLLTYLK